MQLMTISLRIILGGWLRMRSCHLHRNAFFLMVTNWTMPMLSKWWAMVRMARRIWHSVKILRLQWWIVSSCGSLKSCLLTIRETKKRKTSGNVFIKKVCQRVLWWPLMIQSLWWRTSWKIIWRSSVWLVETWHLSLEIRMDGMMAMLLVLMFMIRAWCNKTLFAWTVMYMCWIKCLCHQVVWLKNCEKIVKRKFSAICWIVLVLLITTQPWLLTIKLFIVPM